MKRNSIASVLERLFRFFHLEPWFRLLVLCALVGVVAGLGAVAFDRSLTWLSHVLLRDWLYNTTQENYPYYALILIPALGAGVAGVIAWRFAPEAKGHGTDSVIKAFHQNKGVIPARIPLVKGVCSILTIGSGGSAGKEGPISQIGAGCGSTLATMLKLSVRDRRVLMIAGAAGGIGAIFKAPLGGALFAAEVLYRDPDFEHSAVIPGIISSVTAYSVFTAIDGYERILQFKGISEVTFPSVGGSSLELMHYAILSVICAMVAYLFVKLLKLIETQIFDVMPLPKLARPAIGGAAVGLMAVVLMLGLSPLMIPDQVIGGSHPEHVMAGGYDYLQSAVNSALDTAQSDPMISFKIAGFMGLVVLVKMVTTGLTIGSGGSGGLLFPALFLGGLTGAAYSKLLRAFDEANWLPHSLCMTPGARAGMILVGMGGVFAACTKTPIASLVLVSEITGSYGLAVPLMMTCASAYILSHSFSMNDSQVPGIADSPAHRGDFQLNVLEDLRVFDAILEKNKPETFAADTPLKKVLAKVKDSSATTFPIVDDSGYLIGIFTLSDIRRIMNEPSIDSLIVAGDLGTTEVETVTMDTDLNEALKKLTRKNVDELPVVAADVLLPKTKIRTLSRVIRKPRGAVGTHRVVGMLSRHDLITAYHRKVHAFEHDDALENRGSQVFVDALETQPELPWSAADASDAKNNNEDEVRSHSKFPTVADASNPDEEMLKEPLDDSRKME